MGETGYFIDFTRFEDENRSFVIMVQSRLCAACQQRGDAELKEETPATLVLKVKDCCSKLPGFITPKMAVSEKLFRIFLASGNQPLTVAELLTRLKACSGGSFSLSESALKRLLDNDRYYGFGKCLISNFEGSKDSGVG